jgi:putative FmdB family regulatory protein
MPIYEYRCDGCAHSFEILTSFAERERAHPCPSCESLRTQVVVSTFARSGGGDSAPLDLGAGAGGGGCACGGSCSCRN